MSLGVRALCAALVAALAIAACGGSSHSKSKAHARTGASTSSSSTTPTSSVTSGPVHATLIGENHHPIAGKSWRYEVKVTDSSGHPLNGTVDTEFVFGTTVVGHETPPVHRLKDGVLKDSVTFPPEAVGHPVALQTVVHTKEGTVTLDWPVTARK